MSDPPPAPARGAAPPAAPKRRAQPPVPGAPAGTPPPRRRKKPTGSPLKSEGGRALHAGSLGTIPRGMASPVQALKAQQEKARAEMDAKVAASKDGEETPDAPVEA